MPIYIGGHADASFKRAARLGDGWVSVNTKFDQITEAIAKLKEYRGDLDGFDISVLAVDTFDLDGYRRLGDLGVTHIQAVPWYFYGGDPESLDTRRDSFFRFSEEVIQKF